MVKIAVDLGSEYITIFSKGLGVVLKEPSVVALTKLRKKSALIAAGSKALKMLNRPEKGCNVVFPIGDGAIKNIEAAILMFQEFFIKVSSQSFIRQRVDVLAAVSCGLTVAERRDIELALNRAGANQITLIEAPPTVFQLGNKDNALILIIGKHLTEAAIVSDEGIIMGCSLDIAGDAMNKAIMDYIALKYRVLIGNYAAEKVKISIGSMYENDMSTIEVNGKDLVENAPKSIEITASDVRKALTPLLDKLVEVIDSLMCSCPDTILDEVYRNGIYLAGGSAQLPGIGDYLGLRCKMTATVINDPVNAVATGAGSLLNDENSLKRMLNAADGGTL
jgi:rod shape-determining protein MreB